MRETVKKSFFMLSKVQRRCKVYKEYINVDPRLVDLDLFYGKEKNINYAFSRTRCQVSVYRTIGPLFLNFNLLGLVVQSIVSLTS